MKTPETPQGETPLDQVLETPGGKIYDADGSVLPVELPFSMAFQPIVNVSEGRVFAYEALARGTQGEPAATILEQRHDSNRYAIDQRSRDKALVMAAQLGLMETGADLCLNLYPNAVLEPRTSLLLTFETARSVGIPLTRLILEVTEREEVQDHAHLRSVMQEYQQHGVRVAIDDFGAGHSGLTLLSVFQPDMVKIDQKLVERIDERAASRAIVKALVSMGADMGVEVIAEGVEREEEMNVLCDLGVQRMQGYWFAAPAFEALPKWVGTT